MFHSFFQLSSFEKKFLLSLSQQMILLLALLLIPGFIYVQDNYQLFLKISQINFPELIRELQMEKVWILNYYLLLAAITLPLWFFYNLYQIKKLKEEITHQYKMDLSLQMAQNKISNSKSHSFLKYDEDLHSQKDMNNFIN